VGVTAEYSLRSDGRIKVVNSDFRDDLNGPYREAVGVAWIPDPSRPAALKVRFFWPFSGNYLVFGRNEQDYSWALVGDNSRRQGVFREDEADRPRAGVRPFWFVCGSPKRAMSGKLDGDGHEKRWRLDLGHWSGGERFNLCNRVAEGRRRRNGPCARKTLRRAV